MRLQDKIAINNMRLEGYSPSVIAATLGLPQSTVRSHIHRYPDIPGSKACKNCGKPLVQPKGRREKKFCCDACRMGWWNSHQTEVSRKAYYNLVCQHCGKEFESYGNKKPEILLPEVLCCVQTAVMHRQKAYPQSCDLEFNRAGLLPKIP